MGFLQRVGEIYLVLLLQAQEQFSRQAAPAIY
jgi:hypothetical protein